jgi:hypothetical protein
MSTQSDTAFRETVEEFAVPLQDETAARGRDVDGQGFSVLGLIDLILRDPARLDQLNRTPDRQGELLPKLLLLSQAGYLIYSAVMLFLLNLTPADAWPDRLGITIPHASWRDGTALGLALAYGPGIVLASCICLPSFFFYSLLAGVRMSWLQIAAVIVKGTAANAVMLLGILPIYVALALGLLVFKASAFALAWVMLLGLALPFVAGLWGLWEIYRGVMDLSAALPPAGGYRREGFLRRLTLSWAGVYTAVAPLMIYRLWEWFAGFAPAA